MPPPADLIGRRFGRLTVERLAPDQPGGTGGRLWLCRCDCGTVDVPATTKALSSGRRSCGCIGREKALEGPCALCDRPRYWGVLCHNHGEQWRRWGKPPQAEWIAAYREGRLLTCGICGRGFNGYPNRVTCSRECDEERRRREALARWHALPPEEQREHSRANNARETARRQARRTVLRCQIPACGREFTGYPSRRYCSVECRRQGQYLSSRRFRRKQKVINLAGGAVRMADLAANPSPQPPRRCRLCESRVVGRGLCSKHWNRWKTRGKPDVEAFVAQQQQSGDP